MTKHQLIQRHYNKRSLLTSAYPRYRKTVSSLLKFWWSQDLGAKGDITTQQLIQLPRIRTARVYAKAEGMIAGIEEVVMMCGRKLKVKASLRDGDRVRKNQTVLTLTGRTQDLLKYERIILNVLQRMSGIATTTSRLVSMTTGKCLLCPTRKTLWGDMDKKAVTVGGGGTHRLGLYDFVLVKDNHISLLDRPLIKSKPKGFWEIEVENPEQAVAMAKLKPNAIMFDNMPPRMIRSFIKQLPQDIIFEASGNVSEQTIREYSACGADVVSMGTLTHSVKALDMSMAIV